MKKADLEQRIEELSSTIWDYRRELNTKKEELDEYKKQLDIVNRQLKKSENRIHFLAWMLAREWVTLDDGFYWLDVRVEIPPKEWDRKIL